MLKEIEEKVLLKTERVEEKEHMCQESIGGCCEWDSARVQKRWQSGPGEQQFYMNSVKET